MEVPLCRYALLGMLDSFSSPFCVRAHQGDLTRLSSTGIPIGGGNVRPVSVYMITEGAEGFGGATESRLGRSSEA